jgi:putative transposase
VVGVSPKPQGGHRRFDFFTVPTLTFQLLYCFFVIEHGRRLILHFNVTRHPSAEWVVQQLREAFPEIGPYRYVILDRDSKFDATVITFLKATGLKPKRTSIRSPWQNGTAERWVGSCHREILDHVIALDELLPRRSNSRWPEQRHAQWQTTEQKPPSKATVISSAHLGGLHHRYTWEEAA